MLCPFNRRKMALSQDLAMPVPHACGCLVLHEMLHKVFSFSPASIHRPCHVEDASRAQHPSGMEPHIGDFALRQGCVGKGDSVPMTELDACSARADAPRGLFAADRRLGPSC